MRTTNNQRNGTTLTEIVVAASLLVTTMGIVAPLTVRTGRLWQDSRCQQLVMDELSNEFERLASLTAEQRERAMADLAPPDHLQATLPSANLVAETVRDADGTRLVLSMNWDRPGKPKPVMLVGWLNPLPEKTDPESSEVTP